MAKVTEIVAQLAQPFVQQAGCSLWDVEYVKEAGSWFLRVYIDKEGGVAIDDCEAVSRPLSDALRRRCAYLHIEYPDMDKELAILRAKLPHVDDKLCVQVALATAKLRASDVILKKPSIAEALDWASALDALGIKDLTPDAIRRTAGFVLKNNEDIAAFAEMDVQPHTHCGHCGGHSHG